jgi:hypothetical protein
LGPEISCLDETSQDEADELLREVALPIKGGCEQEPAAAARN